MIKSAVDIGSNTCLLLVAETNQNNDIVKVLREEQRIPRLGKGVDSQGKLHADSLSNLYNALSEYSEIIASFGRGIPVYVTATSAVRDASNGRELIAEIYNQFGWKLHILPGWLEAEITFSGALSRLEKIDDSEEVVVIDIGGGSTEVIIGTKGQGIKNRVSLNAGCVRYTERFSSVSKEEQVIHIRKEISNLLPDEFLNSKAKTMVGVAGTLTSLAAMEINLQTWDAQKVNGITFNDSQLDKCIKSYLKMSSADLLNAFPAIMRGRSDIFHAGLHILSTLFKLLESTKLVISVGGMREGTLRNVDLLKKIS